MPTDTSPKDIAIKKPDWLRRRLPDSAAYHEMDEALLEERLHTVCVSAVCPNKWECFSRRTATFLILGDVCTRACRFCGVAKGAPRPVDADEPARIARAVARFGLRYVVVTSVTRDDLANGGSAQFVGTIRAVRETVPGAKVEVLTPDFRNDREAIESVLRSGPAVFAHNVEMVPRLYAGMRGGLSSYRRSLDVLRYASEFAPHIPVKSGLMAGLGESDDEVFAVMEDLRGAGVDILTIGQYLQPEKNCVPVAKFVAPETFQYYHGRALGLGFRSVFAGPYVRSSYRAEEALKKNDFGDKR